LDKATASPEPGEFTRLFQAPAVEKPGPRPAEVPDGISGTGRSEFTAIFRSPTDAGRPGAPDLQPSAPKEVGDFTRIFGSPGFSAPSSAQLPTSKPAEPANPAQAADNESASGPQGSTVVTPPQPVAQPGPEIPPISPPKVAKNPPLPAPKAPSITRPKFRTSRLFRSGLLSHPSSTHQWLSFLRLHPKYLISRRCRHQTNVLLSCRGSSFWADSFCSGCC
jgi:hypothetical protein